MSAARRTTPSPSSRHVPHKGSPATAHGFRKRVLYLDDTHLSGDLIGAAVDRPDLRDPVLRLRAG